MCVKYVCLPLTIIAGVFRDIFMIGKSSLQHTAICTRLHPTIIAEVFRDVMIVRSSTLQHTAIYIYIYIYQVCSARS